MKNFLSGFLCCFLLGCAGESDRHDNGDANDDAVHDSTLLNSPGVVEPPADTSQFEMPIERSDSNSSDMPVVNPVEPGVQPR